MPCEGQTLCGGPATPPERWGTPSPAIHPLPAAPVLGFGAHVGRQRGGGALWDSRTMGTGALSPIYPIPNAPPRVQGGSPLMPHHFLEGEAAAVAQQGDEGSSAVSPVGRGMVSGDGGPGTSTVSPVPPPCPQPRHRAPTASPNSHLPIPCLLRHQRGLQGQLLLCQRATWGHGHTLGVRGHPPHVSPKAPHSPPSMSRAQRQSRQRCSSLLASAGAALSFSPVLWPYRMGEGGHPACVCVPHPTLRCRTCRRC